MIRTSSTSLISVNFLTSHRHIRRNYKSRIDNNRKPLFGWCKGQNFCATCIPWAWKWPSGPSCKANKCKICTVNENILPNMTCADPTGSIIIRKDLLIDETVCSGLSFSERICALSKPNVNSPFHWSSWNASIQLKCLISDICSIAQYL